MCQCVCQRLVRQGRVYAALSLCGADCICLWYRRCTRGIGDPHLLHSLKEARVMSEGQEAGRKNNIALLTCGGQGWRETGVTAGF